MKDKLIRIWNKCCNSKIDSAKKASGEYNTYTRRGFTINGDYIIILSPSETEVINQSNEKCFISFGYYAITNYRDTYLYDTIYSEEITHDEYNELIELYHNSKTDLTSLIDLLAE